MPKCHTSSVFSGMSQSSHPFLFTSFLLQPSFSAPPPPPAPTQCRRRWVILKIENILRWPYSPQGLSILNNMTASASLVKKATQVHKLSYRSYSASSRVRGGRGLPKQSSFNCWKALPLEQNSAHLPRGLPYSEHLQTKMILLFFLLYQSSITVFMSWSVTRFMCLPTFHKVRGHMIKIQE